MNVSASVATSLRQQGLHLSDEFIQASVAGGTSQDSESNVFEKSLHCDFNVCAVGCLPSDIESWDKKLLEGRVVLQVDELTDMAANAKQRYMSWAIQSGAGIRLCLFDCMPSVYHASILLQI